MRGIDAVRMSLKFNETDLALIEDLRDAPLAQPSPAGGNHALWLAGHLAVAEGMLREVVLGEPSPVEQWKPLFDRGTVPQTDAGLYPAFDELVGTYKDLRAQSFQLLEEIGDEGLDGATQAPPAGMEDWFATVGQTFLVIATHFSFHGGEAAAVRRTLGRKPLFM